MIKRNLSTILVELGVVVTFAHARRLCGVDAVYVNGNKANNALTQVEAPAKIRVGKDEYIWNPTE